MIGERESEPEQAMQEKMTTKNRNPHQKMYAKSISTKCSQIIVLQKWIWQSWKKDKKNEVYQTLWEYHVRSKSKEKQADKQKGIELRFVGVVKVKKEKRRKFARWYHRAGGITIAEKCKRNMWKDAD